MRRFFPGNINANFVDEFISSSRRAMTRKHNAFKILFFVILSAVVLPGCDLAPAKPEEAFNVYRDKMKSGQLTSARQMLSTETLNIIQRIESNHHLDQPSENIAVLNTLDPTVFPSVVKIEETQALLEAKTLKGTNKQINLFRSDSKGKWKVDWVYELNQLENFLAARKTLDSMQEQAGEFAATWKAMDNQLSKKAVGEADKETRETPRDQKKTQPKKSSKAQKKGPSGKDE